MTHQPKTADDMETNLLLNATASGERGPYLDRNKIPTLDLHGYFLEAAIKKLVEFLEKHYDQKQRAAKARSSNGASCNEMILQVVTGTGSHSNQARGPVLKYAVNDFLQRHSFLFTYYSNGGYFVIPLQNNSGTLSYQAKTCNVSTKIIIATSPCTEGKTCSNHMKKSRNKIQSLKSEQEGVRYNDMPTLQEVVYEEKELQRGVSESLEEYRQRQKEYSKEQKLYQQAIHVSKEEIIKAETEEKLILERVIRESVELSERDYDNDAEEEISAFKQAIMESLEDSSHCVDNEQDDDAILQRAMEESKCFYEASERDADDYDDNDDILQRVIEESKAIHEVFEHNKVHDYFIQSTILESEATQTDTSKHDSINLRTSAIFERNEKVSEHVEDEQSHDNSNLRITTIFERNEKLSGHDEDEQSHTPSMIIKELSRLA